MQQVAAMRNILFVLPASRWSGDAVGTALFYGKAGWGVGDVTLQTKFDVRAFTQQPRPNGQR
jgi:hypothetical protein